MKHSNSTRNLIGVSLLCAFGALLSTAPANAASKTLSISGTPASTVIAAGNYSFQPTAKDKVRSRIKFDITNKPTWASFDGTTGHLYGTPNSRQVGTYSNISIRLTDWYGYVTTKPFSITVTRRPTVATPPVVVVPPVVVAPPAATPPGNQTSAGNATLDWTAPTENSDGSVLANLAGYKVHYGTSPDQMTQVIKVANPGLTAYVVDGLAAGTWYFTVTSYASDGTESVNSATVSTKIL